VAIREWIFHIDPHSLDGMSTSFPAMFDYLAAGCALALLRPWLLTRMWYLQLTASPWLALAVPLVLLINRMGSHTAVILLGSPLMNVCIALLIESSTRHASSLAGRLLNWKPVVFLGVLSYSLYLWQSPFLNHRSDAWLHAFPQNLVCAPSSVCAGSCGVAVGCLHACKAMHAVSGQYCATLATVHRHK